MLMTDERLTSRPERPYKTPVPQVSPDLLREAVARRVSGDVTPAIIELCGYLDTYIAGKYLIRYPSRSEAILLVFKGKNSSEIGGILQELPRTIRKWREHFFAQASEYMQRQHARRRLSIWDDVLRPDAQVWRRGWKHATNRARKLQCEELSVLRCQGRTPVDVPGRPVHRVQGVRHGKQASLPRQKSPGHGGPARWPIRERGSPKIQNPGQHGKGMGI